MIRLTTKPPTQYHIGDLLNLLRAEWYDSISENYDKMENLLLSVPHSNVFHFPQMKQYCIPRSPPKS